VEHCGGLAVIILVVRSWGELRKELATIRVRGKIVSPAKLYADICSRRGRGRFRVSGNAEISISCWGEQGGCWDGSRLVEKILVSNDDRDGRYNGIALLSRELKGAKARDNDEEKNKRSGFHFGLHFEAARTGRNSERHVYGHPGVIPRSYAGVIVSGHTGKRGEQLETELYGRHG
jgi:hypothetical protein